MAKGNPDLDVAMVGVVRQAMAELTTRKMLVNLDQKTLRDIRYELEIGLASVNKYLDIRNEQGRGGEK